VDVVVEKDALNNVSYKTYDALSWTSPASTDTFNQNPNSGNRKQTASASFNIFMTGSQQKIA